MTAKPSRRAASPLSMHRIQAGNYQSMELQDVQQVLPMVRSMTRRAVLELDPLQIRLNSMVPADPRNIEVKQAYQRVVQNWAGKIERLGYKVHGLWQVGFDGGSGWYGWQYPERSVRYFLEYDALFDDRCLIRDHLQEQDRISRR